MTASALCASVLISLGAAKILSPKHREIAESWGRPKVMQSVSPLRTVTLAWLGIPNQDVITNFVYEVWSSTDLYPLSIAPRRATYDTPPVGFSLVMTTSQTVALIQNNLPVQFFLVRAKELTTGKYSPFNQISSGVSWPIIGVMMTSLTNGQTVSGTISLAARVVTLDPPTGLIIASQ